MDRIAASVEERFSSEIVNGVVRIHRKSSVEAAEDFEDRYFDWVYLDADHTYDAVMADLTAYLPKVRVGGLVTGDDYGASGWWEDGVRRAVQTIADEAPVKLERIIGFQFVLRKME